MIQLEAIPSVMSLLEGLARFVASHDQFHALVTGANSIEESLSPPAPDRGPGPDSDLGFPPEDEPRDDPPVSALRRRWLLVSDAVLDWTAGVLYRFHLRKWGKAVEDCCPAESVGFCSGCGARELESRTLFCEEQGVCAACFRRMLRLANRGRTPREPELTSSFLAELLSLHRVPYWLLGEDEARQRNDTDAQVMMARLHSMAGLELRVMHRWAVAIAPVAVELQVVTRALSALLTDPGCANHK